MATTDRQTDMTPEMAVGIEITLDNSVTSVTTETEVKDHIVQTDNLTTMVRDKDKTLTSEGGLEKELRTEEEMLVLTTVNTTEAIAFRDANTTAIALRAEREVDSRRKAIRNRTGSKANLLRERPQNQQVKKLCSHVGYVEKQGISIKNASKKGLYPFNVKCKWRA